MKIKTISAAIALSLLSGTAMADYNGEDLTGLFKGSNVTSDIEFKATHSADSTDVSSEYSTDAGIIGKKSSINPKFVLNNESSSVGICQAGINDGATRSNGGTLEECKNGFWQEMDIGSGGGGNMCIYNIKSLNGYMAVYDYTNSRSGKLAGYFTGHTGVKVQYNGSSILHPSDYGYQGTLLNGNNTLMGTYYRNQWASAPAVLSTKVHIPVNSTGIKYNFGSRYFMSTTKIYGSSVVKCVMNSTTGSLQVNVTKATYTSEREWDPG